MFGWLRPVAGVDLLQEKSTAGWLVLMANADLVWKENTIGWLADNPTEQV